MKILITGGFGYLGGRLAKDLASRGGHEIVLGSRLQVKPPSWLPHVKVVQTRWNSQTDLENMCGGLDVVIHLAGMNAHDCALNPTEALEINGVNTARFLQSAIQKKVKRFIYVSTAHVYRNPLVGTITEETCTTNVHPYATSHRAGEDVVRFAHQRGEIEGIVIRLSNAFGAPLSPETNCWMLLVNDLCRQAVTSQRMVLQSSGLQRRDFVPLTDACRATEHLLELSSEKLGNGLFNVGGAWTPRVIDIAETIQTRCSEVLRFRPNIIRPKPHDGEITMDLDFRIDKLLASGFALFGNTAAEIDATLLLCRESFGGDQ